MGVFSPSTGAKPGHTLPWLGPNHNRVSGLARGLAPTIAGPAARAPHRRRARSLAPRIAAQGGSATAAAPDHAGTIYERSFPLPGGATMTAVVAAAADGAQEVLISTDAPGRLLLHWGVEGGHRYKGGGWRLPGDSCRPEGTVEYKKRALQTPFHPAAGGDGGRQEVRLRLAGDEASDYLDFVLKDTAADRWYDLNGGNFQIPLRSDAAAAAGAAASPQKGSNGSQNRASSDAGSSQTAEPALKSDKDLLPPDQIPPIPQDLAGVWAYMKWEAAGCPGRSKEDADSEYAATLQELATLLRRRVSLGDLQGVAAAGVGRYVEFMEDQARKWTVGGGAQQQRVEESKKPEILQVPEALVGLKAYAMWEAAGRPDGADYGAAAREALAAELATGKSVHHLEEELRGPPQDQEQQQQEQAATAPLLPPPPPPPPAPEPEIVVGQSMGMRERNPLDLIHRSSAPRLAEPARPRETPLGPLLAAAQEDETCVWHRLYGLGSKAELLVTVKQAVPGDVSSPVEVTLTTDAAADMVLHWGVKKAGRSGEWKRPDTSILPPNTELIKDGIAAETPFTGCDEEECHVEIGGALVPLQRVSVDLPSGHGLTALTFVIRSEDGTRWWNDGGANFAAPVPGPAPAAVKNPALAFEDELSRVIVDCEVNTGAWTLMHRFNKAAELIAGVLEGRYAPADDAMARIFVWLRYSAIRQLTWQRNYNTQPRILGAAQERLTHAIGDAYDRLTGTAQEWARLCLTTVGRGGNAQAVRDEILNIMHRNKISEVKGTWMEEFHQKLHNNTTPDDVPICEAYLAFLRADGDLGAYRRVLSEAGISRQRLESFDRPIVTDPVFFPEKKDALIVDFSNYLNILKATHSGADLQASASAAAPFVPGAAKGYLGYVLGHATDGAVLPLVEAAVEARTELAAGLTSNRELIYLDLALENVVRAAAERGAAAAGTGAAALVAPLLQNLALSLADNEEICYCLKAWLELSAGVRQGAPPSKDDALRAMAVVDRVRRALGDVSTAMSDALSGIASDFGHAFGCEAWAVELFAEEIVRGGPAFAISLVLSSIEPGLRAAAELGAWSVISPAASATGRLVVVPSLHGIQDKVFEEPTVLLARRVTGEEEVPLGVIGVLSGDAPDVLSHLAVRTRNLRILFAACYDVAQLDEVAALEGAAVEVGTTAAGGVTWTVLDESSSSSSMSSQDNNGAGSGAATHHHHHHRKKLEMAVPPWSGRWTVGMDSYKDGVVGAKSKNLAGLRGKLPDWIRLPPSCTVPFGSFEEALRKKENADVAAKLKAEVAAVTPSDAVARLATCRALAERVVVPEEAQAELRDGMAAAGIPVPAAGSPEWDAALASLRAVWASKYNDRAYVSTRKVGIAFDDVRMAVLVQAVVCPRYAFVIHTVNPMSGDTNEIYCELVRGLGEAIVSGTVPGTALAFAARKDSLDDPRVLLYPSKSEGMFVDDGALIFRSDSNGEDLEGYAGAGLYDSVPTATTYNRVVDYSSDSIVADPGFARDIMTKVARVGAEIEAALGSPQDIEGVIDPEGNVYVVQTRPQM